MGHDRCVRCHARDTGRTGGAAYSRRHDRQHGGPGTSLCRGHKKGTGAAEALGRSRGGFTTKLHARCDVKGRPLAFVLTPGQAHDTQGFGPLMRMIADRIDAKSDGERACAIELALEGLYLIRKIDKQSGDRETIYG